MRVRFDDYEIDTKAYEVRHGGVPVPVEPQVFDVLADLVERAGQLVTKENLLDRVWGDQFVSESALTSRIKSARRALGDDGRQQRYIKTVHGRGYRFVADLVTEESSADDREAGGGAVPIDTMTRPGHNLPTDRTPLVGRETDIERIADLLDRHRLVSLLGMGGIGKTRLAIACGRQVAARFGDGVWFVDLVPATGERSVVRAMAEAADLALTGGAGPDELAGLVADRHCLFVLDNCEHVADGVATTLDHLLARTTAPRFLVTSRVPLDLPDERRVRIGPLPAGDADESGPALQLLLASAERFAVHVDRLDLDLARSLCHQLDGLPLALELAAAQLRHLGLADLVSLLEHRFDILEAGRRTDDRHAGLATILTETWGRLEPNSSELLVQLAMFPATFSLTDAEEVTDDLVPAELRRALAALIDLSLVDHLADRGRYRILETVRLFARQQGDPATVERAVERHTSWCQRQMDVGGVSHLSDFRVALWGLDHADDLLQAEEQLRVTGRVGDAADLIAAQALALHLDLGTGAAHALERIDHLVPSVEDDERATGLHLAGVMAAMAARAPGQLARHGTAAVDRARRSGDDSLIAAALVLASWSTALVEPERALTMVEEASELAARSDDPVARDFADAYQAFHLANLRRWDEAIARGDEVMRRVDAQDARYANFAAAVAVSACCALSDPDRAARAFQMVESSPGGIAMWGIQMLGAAITASQGEVGETARIVDSVVTSLDRRGLSGLPDMLVPAAILAHRLGDRDRAEQWLRVVRDAPRSTQSFQLTFVFRRARDEIGLADTSPLADRDLDEIGAEARAWLTSLIDS